MLAVGTAAQVEEYVTKLLDECAADGGFILSAGAVVDDAKPETVKAMIRDGVVPGPADREIRAAAAGECDPS